MTTTTENGQRVNPGTVATKAIKIGAYRITPKVGGVLAAALLPAGIAAKVIIDTLPYAISKIGEYVSLGYQAGEGLWENTQTMTGKGLETAVWGVGAFAL